MQSGPAAKEHGRPSLPALCFVTVTVVIVPLVLLPESVFLSLSLALVKSSMVGLN